MSRTILNARRSRLSAAAVAALGTTVVQAASVSWDGGGSSSFWDVATNWGANVLPAAGDEVLLGSFDTTLRSGNFALQSFSGTGTLSITGGSLSNSLASTVGGLNLAGGAIGGTGATAITGVLTWSGGSITGAGSTDAATVTIIGSNGKTLSGGRILNAVNTTWSGNTAANNNAIAISGGSIFNSSGSFFDSNAFDSALTRGNGGGTFNNLGTFSKQSATTTTIGTAFNNTGTVNVNAGTLLLSSIEASTSSGVYNIASGAKLEIRNGSHTLNNVTTQGDGVFQISTENVGADASVVLNGGTHTTAFVLSGSTLSGDNHTFQGLATWSGGTITGSAAQSTTFANDLSISGANGKTLSGGRAVNAGNTVWSGNTAAKNNAIAISGGSVFNSSGTFTDANTFDSVMNRGNGGGRFVNAGTFDKQSATTTTLGTAFDNHGTVNVNAGTLLLSAVDASTSNGGVYNIAGGAKLEIRNGSHTLNSVTTQGAGVFQISTENVGADAVVYVNGGAHTTAFVLSGSTMAGSDASFKGLATWTGGTISGAATTTFDNNVGITGANTKVIVGGRNVVLNGTTSWSGNTAANNNAIRFWNGATVTNNGTFNDANAFASFIEHNVGGPHNFVNNGTYNKLQNTLTTVDLGVGFTNAGTLNLNAGTMHFASGTQGPTGAVRVASGATFQIGANSSVGNFVTAGNTALADRTLTIHGDYDNANFGTGNGFNRRANVSTTGAATPRLLAAGDANQGLSGSGIGNGNTAAPTLQLGNVHVGANIYTYRINNTGTTGPALRGAIQDATNGGSISDTRLSGSGVQAGNFGPIGTGQSVSRDIVFTVGSGGVYAPLSGQAVSIVNNFENTRSQLLSFSSLAGAAAYYLADAAVAPNPVNLGNQRVGGTASAALTVANAAPAGAYTEGLNASFGTLSGSVLTNGGSVNLLTGGASNSSAMTVRLDSSTAGAKTGTAQILLASDGSGSSGLGVTQLAPQIVTVSGAFYNMAVGSTTPTPVVIANQRVGGTLSQALSVANTAAPGSFSEALNAGFGGKTGAATTNGGSVANLIAGGFDASSMRVGIDTGSSGARSGNVTLAYQSDGTGANGNSGLAAIGAGSQTISVLGNVYQAAGGALQTTALNFGTLQVGQAVTQDLVVRNTAAGAAGFVEDLNVAFGSSGNSQISGAGSLSGIAAGSNSSLANGKMTVTVTGSSAGALNSGIGVNYFSAGAVGGVSNGLGTLAVGSEMFAVNGTISAVGNVINQASPLLNTPGIDLGAVRVGATAPSATVSVTNVAGTAPQAALNASISPGGGPVTASGSFNLLSPGGTNDTSLRVGLNTATAGNFTGGNAGTATLNLVSDASNVGNCGANCQLSLGSQSVSVQGKVYTQAVGELATGAVDFGIVRVGDVVAARNITVQNSAAASALNDTLRADLSGLTAPFTGGGSVAGVAAQGSGTISVGLSTLNAGVFSQTGSVAFLSQNPDMADVSAGANAGVQLKAQVNNLANADFDLQAGIGVLRQFGTQYVLDLGNIVIGSLISELLRLENEVAGPADALRGMFNLSAADDFSYADWNPFSGLGAGSAVGGLSIAFGATKLGMFEDTIVFNGFGYNASDPTGLAQSRSLLIRANVVDGSSAVPEPGTVGLAGLAMLLLAGLRGKRASA
jgi:hypothetical protein